MATANEPAQEIEETGRYVTNDTNELALESTEDYVKRVRAEKERDKAKVANWVALILVVGIVASLPFYVFSVWLVGSDSTDINAVFDKWYDVTAPLLGAVIGALFGLSIANRNNE